MFTCTCMSIRFCINVVISITAVVVFTYIICIILYYSIIVLCTFQYYAIINFVFMFIHRQAFTAFSFHKSVIVCLEIITLSN